MPSIHPGKGRQHLRFLARRPRHADRPDPADCRQDLDAAADPA
jgi:hypothetical protein